jgi:hypothetical protein
MIGYIYNFTKNDNYPLLKKKYHLYTFFHSYEVKKVNLALATARFTHKFFSIRFSK